MRSRSVQLFWVPSLLDCQALILLLRPDVREACQTFDQFTPLKYRKWLLVHGLVQYPALAADIDLQAFAMAENRNSKFGLTTLQQLIYEARPDVQTAFSLATQKQHFLWWFYTLGLNEHKFWFYLSKAEQDFVRSLPAPWASRLSDLDHPQTIAHTPITKFEDRSFGVNVIGYAYGQLGIGEDARMAARSLIAAKVPFSMISMAPGVEISQNDRSMQSHVAERGEFAINVFCLIAEETGRYYAEQGAAQFNHRYNIGYWPWELSAWPVALNMLFALVDEVWVSSQHTFDALEKVCDKPLYLMPMAVDLGAVTRFDSQATARAHFGLPVQAKLFCFAFDLNSYIDRKNPQACVEAFLLAFGKVDDLAGKVGLVIKVHAPTQPNEAWSNLKALAARDRRIHIIEQTLDRPALLALYQTCDCFVSLHRAEGFGRGLAEALQLGLRVICTGYSGNLDFCRTPNAELVDYHLVRVGESQYPHATGQYWAEPSVQHAAQLMKKVFGLPRPKRTAEDFSEFSTTVVGQRYEKRLNEIYAKRHDTQLAFGTDG